MLQRLQRQVSSHLRISPAPRSLGGSSSSSSSSWRLESRRLTILLTGQSARYSTYGFVGLGKMGYPMSKNLRLAIPPTDAFLVYDVNRNASEQLSREVDGVTVVEELSRIGREADVIVTMLPNSSHVEECYLSSTGLQLQQQQQQQRKGKEEDKEDGSEGSCSSLRERLFVDCSTIDPFTSQSIASSVSLAGTFLDAPVSGGVSGAAKASLSFMLGMPTEHPAADRLVTTVLRHMGQTFHFCGKNGNGLAAKLSNNYLLALNNLATCEAMLLGLRMGLASDTLGRVINSSTGRCWPSLSNNPVVGVTEGAPCERDYAGGFGIELMMKDLTLAIEAANKANVVLPGAEEALARYRMVAKDEQCRGRDFGVVYKYLQQQNHRGS